LWEGRERVTGRNKEANRGEVRETVERVKGGDREAFDQLWVHYEKRLELWCRHQMSPLLQRYNPIEEVLQETFLRAFLALKKGAFKWRDSLKCPLRDEVCLFCWLTRIAEHVIVDASRRLPREVEGIRLDDFSDGTPSPEKLHRREARFRRLKEALDRLSPPRRKVVMLMKVMGLSRKEVALALGRSPGAISVVLYRALSQLKEFFGITSSFSLPRWSLEDGGESKEKPEEENGQGKAAGKKS
jgi:RNA polymerase sigma-70 factor, ECF subfamily